MRKKRIVFGIAFVISCYFLYIIVCNKDENHYINNTFNIIAHGGGAINGHTYTNSLEAFNNSIERGYKYIELDLNLTSDSVLVATHDFAIPTTVQNFMQSKIQSKYTPLSAFDIDSLLACHPNIIVVLDKISDPELLDKYFTHKNQIIVEAFNYHDYITLLQSGYQKVFFSILATDLHTTLLKHLFFHRFFPGKKIEYIVAHHNIFRGRMFKLLNLLHYNYKLALYTINDITTIPMDEISKVEFIYTDSLPPTVCRDDLSR